LATEGPSRVFQQVSDLTLHAEMEAQRSVLEDLWISPEKLTLYTTLEPCLMGLGAILLFGVGRVVFGASDPYGEGEIICSDLPIFFQERFKAIQWEGPLLPEQCDPLFQRLLEIEGKL